MKDIPLYFVVGIGRSGTTLLQSILSMHPNICAPIESKLIVHLWKRYGKIKKWDKSLLNKFIYDLYNKPKFFNYWNIEKSELYEKFINLDVNEIDYKTLIKIIYTSFKYKKDEVKDEIKVIVDKNPEYIHFIDKLIEIFPDTKFIHIIRDYRDNVYSVKRLTDVKSGSFLVENWLQGNLFAEKYKKKYPEKFCTIRYEDLVYNKEKIIKEVLCFLNVEYTETVFNYTEIAQEINTKNLEAFNHFHTELLKPVNTNNIGKWERGLSKNEINYLNYRANNYAGKLGYTSEHKFKIAYPFKKIISILKFRINISIIRGYYFYFPIWFTNMLSNISLKLFLWFKLKTYYSKDRFQFINDKKNISDNI